MKLILRLCGVCLVVLSGMSAHAQVVIDPTTPTTLYTVMGDSYLFKSTDGGASWTAIQCGKERFDWTPPACTEKGTSWPAVHRCITDLGDLEIAPTTPPTLYTTFSGLDPQALNPAEESCGGIVKSTDGGRSWTVSLILTDTSVPALAIDPITPTTLYAGLNGGSKGGGILKSTDGGRSWTASNHGLSSHHDRLPPLVITLEIDPTTPTTLYAGTNGEGLFKSIDGGGSWTNSNRDLPSDAGYIQTFSLVIDPTTPTTLYVANVGSAGIFKSTDGGANWTALHRAGPEHYAVSRPVIDPQTPMTLYISGREGIYKSTDGGQSWTVSHRGLSLYHEPGCRGEQKECEYYSVGEVVIDPFTPTTLYAGVSIRISGSKSIFKKNTTGETTAPFSHLCSYQSTDGGVTWTPCDTRLPGSGPRQ